MLYRLRERLMRFMMGRYGPDTLYTVILIACLILAVVDMFVRSWIISLIMVGLWIWALYRAMSKNIYKRRKENEFVLRLKNKTVFFFKTASKKFKERKTHVYRKCANCKAQLRLPRKKGTLKVRCPKCGNSFQIKIR